MALLSIAIFSLSQSNRVLALDNNCSSLASLSCGENDLPDGTGPGKNGRTHLTTKFLAELSAPRFLQKLRKNISSAFVDSPAYWQLVHSVFAKESCKGVLRFRENSKCDEAVLEELTALLTRFQTASSYYEKYAEILESPKTQQIARGYLQNRFGQSKIRARYKHLDLLLKKLQASALKQIAGWKLPPEESKFLQARIQRVKLAGFRKIFDRLGDSGTIIGDYLPQATYGDVEGLIYVEPSFLAHTTSELSLLFILGHELGHAIDSCRLKSHGVSDLNYPLNNVKNCLLINADQLQEASPLMPVAFVRSADWGCELFADWFAAELLGGVVPGFVKYDLTEVQWTNGFANSLRHSCVSILGFSESDYPTTSLRYNVVLEPHPILRALRGCKSGAPKMLYCAPPL